MTTGPQQYSDEAGGACQDSPPALVCVDRQQRCFAANHRFLELVGKPREQCLGRTLRELVPDLAPYLDPWLQRTLETREAAADLPVPLPVGVGERLRLACWPLVAEDGSLLGAAVELSEADSVAHDVGARRLAEQRLDEARDESERRYRALFENKAVAAICLEVGTGRIRDANPAACAFYGYTREELVGLAIAAFDPPGTPAREAWLAEPRSGEPAYFECVQQLRNGEVREVEVYPSHMEWQGGRLAYCLIHDVTARHQAEAELANRVRFEALLAELSGRLVATATADFDHVLQSSLKSIVLTLGLRGVMVVLQPGADRDTAVVSHGWSAERGLIPLGLTFGLEEAPWAFAQVRAGAIMRLDGSHPLPPEAAGDLPVIEKLGNFHGLGIPLMTSGESLGCMAFLAPAGEWEPSEERVQRAQTIAEVFANALGRKRAEARAAEREAELREEERVRAEVALRFARLTPREHEVLRLVIAGKLNKQIATQLGITEKTVKVHRGRVMEKSGAGSLAELVRLAEKAGITPPGEAD